MRARRSRPGRHLRPVDALRLLGHDEELMAFHKRCIADGYVLKKTVRPYHRQDGGLTCRFIWRKRAEDPAMTIEYTVRWRVARD
ncbi:phage-related hypothetical protein [Tepidicaulis marinus]|uniref:Uncharacterized protein n=1 Tax=Tepidicaulis marinus TaxID=1333998 RepID=A0A081B6E9_9HYPH|nr:hypothetical protein [Tepidicaulis marinus]GAK43617.1 phage-related hypothetical protein [Tepidicaulis marinus]